MKEILKELTPLSDNDLFIVLNHPSAKFDFPVHHHSDYEINLVMNTYGKRIVGNSEEDFSDLDLVMIGPNVPHVWKGEIVEGNHVVTIQFSEKFLNFQILEKRLFKQIKELLYKSQMGLSFPTHICEEVRDKILHLTNTHGFESVLGFLSILDTLSTADYRLLIDSTYDTQYLVRASKSRRIAKVCDYIESNYQKPIKLEEVASMINMSGSAFSHFFKRKTNSTFIDHIINYRISKACQLLTETSNSIAEICFECGFNNISNFIRIFKKKKGTTPSQYRASIEQMLIKY